MNVVIILISTPVASSQSKQINLLLNNSLENISYWHRCHAALFLKIKVMGGFYYRIFYREFLYWLLIHLKSREYVDGHNIS